MKTWAFCCVGKYSFCFGINKKFNFAHLLYCIYDQIAFTQSSTSSSPHLFHTITSVQPIHKSAHRCMYYTQVNQSRAALLYLPLSLPLTTTLTRCQSFHPTLAQSIFKAPGNHKLIFRSSVTVSVLWSHLIWGDDGRSLGKAIINCWSAYLNVHRKTTQLRWSRWWGVSTIAGSEESVGGDMASDVVANSLLLAVSGAPTEHIFVMV